MSGFYSGVGRGPHRGRGFGTAACAAVNLICVCHWAKCSILALMWYNNSIHGCSGVLNTVNHSVTECKCKEKWEKITSLKKQSQTQDEGERRWRTGTEPDWDVWVELSLLALTAAQRSQTFPLILWWNVASSFGRYSEPKSSIDANRLVWTPQGPSSQQGTQPPLLYRGGARGQVHKGVMGMWRSRGRSIMSPIECKSNSRDTLCPMLWCNHYVSVGEWQVRYSTWVLHHSVYTHTHLELSSVCRLLLLSAIDPTESPDKWGWFAWSEATADRVGRSHIHTELYLMFSSFLLRSSSPAWSFSANSHFRIPCWKTLNQTKSNVPQPQCGSDFSIQSSSSPPFMTPCNTWFHYTTHAIF